MPHADSSLVPERTKTEFWEHVHTQLGYLLEGQRNWVTNLANASSLIFNSLLDFPAYFGPDHDKAVNWCGGCLIRLTEKLFGISSPIVAPAARLLIHLLTGFYLNSHLFPTPCETSASGVDAVIPERLLLGPFCGKPACQFININPKLARGVCADAFLQQKTLVVPDVDQYPGHIACDGETKSEIVCPLFLQHENKTQEPLGVLDLDCLAAGAFDEEDRVGLEKISRLLVSVCDW